MDDEPSLFAQQVMNRIVEGRSVVLTDREVFELTEYERNVINRAARKRGFVRWEHPPTGAIKFAPPASPSHEPHK